MALICGIDEAGRGPVIGPMVIAGATFKEEDLSKLKSLDVKDSKLLTPQQREKLFASILALSISHKIIIIEPKEIDDALKAIDLNLNLLEAMKQAEIINLLRPDKVYIDCPSPNIKTFEIYLKKQLTHQPELIVEHKADVNYIACAASSILAKVTRDKEIRELAKKYGNIGSGYMSDPITQDFLKSNWEKHKEIFRKTWIPYKNHENSKLQKSINDF